MEQQKENLKVFSERLGMVSPDKTAEIFQQKTGIVLLRSNKSNEIVFSKKSTFSNSPFGRKECSFLNPDETFSDLTWGFSCQKSKNFPLQFRKKNVFTWINYSRQKFFLGQEVFTSKISPGNATTISDNTVWSFSTKAGIRWLKVRKKPWYFLFHFEKEYTSRNFSGHVEWSFDSTAKTTASEVSELVDGTTKGKNLFSQRYFLKIYPKKLEWSSDNTAENIPTENRIFFA